MVIEQAWGQDGYILLVQVHFFCIYAPRSQGLQKRSQKKPLSILIFTEQASQ